MIRAIVYFTFQTKERVGFNIDHYISHNWEDTQLSIYLVGAEIEIFDVEESDIQKFETNLQHALKLLPPKEEFFPKPDTIKAG